MAKPIHETWALSSADTTAIPSANRADGTANKWSDIWKYQVPSGQSHILRPNHHLYLKGYDTTTAEVGNGTCQVRIVRRDQSEQGEDSFYGPALYVASKDPSDLNKMARLQLQGDMEVPELFYIVIQVKDDATFDESISHFKLETVRVRYSI